MADYDGFFEEFPGFGAPGWTQVPDAVLDEIMPRLGHAELKVLLYIIRRTYGWQKQAERISLQQLAAGTGLGLASVKRGVKDLEAKRLIVVTRDLSQLGEAAVNSYSLRMMEGGRPKMSLPQAQNEPTRIESRDKRHKQTESEAPPMPERQQRSAAASDDSDSDDLHTWAETTATALGRPGEAKQLATWARKQRLPLEVLQAAGEVTLQQHDLTKPVAYLQTVAKVMAADRAAAETAGERERADRQRDALAYARQVYSDPVIGGSWSSVASIVAESYGQDLAAEVLDRLQHP